MSERGLVLRGARCGVRRTVMGYRRQTPAVDARGGRPSEHHPACRSSALSEGYRWGRGSAGLAWEASHRAEPWLSARGRGRQGDGGHSQVRTVGHSARVGTPHARRAKDSWFRRNDVGTLSVYRENLVRLTPNSRARFTTFGSLPLCSRSARAGVLEGSVRLARTKNPVVVCHAIVGKLTRRGRLRRVAAPARTRGRGGGVPPRLDAASSV